MSTVQDIIDAVATYNAANVSLNAESAIKDAAQIALYAAGVAGQAAVDAAIADMETSIADAQAVFDAAAPNLAAYATASQDAYQAVLAAVTALEP
jgi:hypothetical protein